MESAPRIDARSASLLRLGALLGLLGVSFGAFGAHGLEGALEDLGPDAVAERLDWWETAAQYHLLHAVALVAVVAALGARGRVPALFLAAGIAVFSGTLYAMGLGAPRWFGAITPIGGVLLMVGWGLAMNAARATDAQ
ncbi:MAG: DUF423 domain-containing protein [Planctomycetota bacterium]